MSLSLQQICTQMRVRTRTRPADRLFTCYAQVKPSVDFPQSIQQTHKKVLSTKPMKILLHHRGGLP